MGNGITSPAIPLSLFVIIVVRNVKTMMTNEDHEEEEYALGRLMELVKSLCAETESFKFEESAEDFPVLEVDVLGSSTEDDDEDSIVVEALHSAPEVPVVSIFHDYLDQE
jgi:hypothetical protein